eukprot:TRINITY_DN40062_c0_g1_i1.p1 TRINITY_DN40062_c0_g1~~TRINITY_DN40062_c0_g1_i1.p1  ORF type:complete len:175 (+),score=35.85 TRINITY_DN40062_c0_g1_i1:58-582(+)
MATHKCEWCLSDAPAEDRPGSQPWGPVLQRTEHVQVTYESSTQTALRDRMDAVSQQYLAWKIGEVEQRHHLPQGMLLMPVSSMTFAIKAIYRAQVKNPHRDQRKRDFRGVKWGIAFAAVAGGIAAGVGHAVMHRPAPATITPAPPQRRPLQTATSVWGERPRQLPTPPQRSAPY